jgi:RND family efflux transporter MFP subunit
VDTFLYAGLSNAALAVVLALLAAAGGWLWRRRPVVVHSLWLLVLLKLLTPSLVHVPLPGAGTTPVEIRTGLTDPPGEAIDSSRPPSAVSDAPPPASVGPAPAARPFPWLPALVALWLAGAVVYWATAVVRLRRFGRLLRAARPAPADMSERVARVAARLGLRRPPGAWLVPGRVPPMLWAPGGPPRLLLPAELWGRLSEPQQEAVLAHELAHLRRRDHWVRWLELAAVGLYWWHPAAWWARRQVEQAEEQCCDAWVVWALPAAAEAYAIALLATVSFLSGPRPAAPAWASGAGSVRTLKRRLGMILNGSTRGAASLTVPRAVLALGAVALVLLPACSPLEPPEPAPSAPAPTQPAPAQPAPAPPAPGQAAPPGRDVLTFVGRVVPAREYHIGAAAPGLVLRLAVEPGAIVKKGELLVQLDDRRARAEYERAAANLQHASAVYQRMKALAGVGNAVTKAELDQAAAGLKIAEADAAVARLSLDVTKVVAPADGTVLTWYVGPGSAVAAGAALCDLADLRNLEAEVSVDERSLAKVSRGQRCLIQTLVGGMTYKGSVRFINPVVDPASGTARVRISVELPANDGRLRSGSAVNVQFLAKD